MIYLRILKCWRRPPIKKAEKKAEKKVEGQVERIVKGKAEMKVGKEAGRN